MRELVSYDRGFEYAAERFSETVAENLEIVEKSTRALLRTSSLINLPEEIRAAIVPPLSGLNRTEGTGRSGSDHTPVK